MKRLVAIGLAVFCMMWGVLPAAAAPEVDSATLQKKWNLNWEGSNGSTWAKLAGPGMENVVAVRLSCLETPGVIVESTRISVDTEEDKAKAFFKKNQAFTLIPADAQKGSTYVIDIAVETVSGAIENFSDKIKINGK